MECSCWLQRSERSALEVYPVALGRDDSAMQNIYGFQRGDLPASMCAKRQAGTEYAEVRREEF